MVTKRTITSQHAKDVSRRLRSATLGTHASHGGSFGARPSRGTRMGGGSRRHMNAASVGFSNPRKQRRATRGYVDNVMPLPNAGVPRRSNREFQQEVRRRSLARTVLSLAVCVALIVGVVGFVGTSVFRASVDSQMGLDSDAVNEVLVAPGKEDTSHYVLVSADLDEEGLHKLGDGADALALVRVDQEQQQVAAAVLPANSLVTLSDSNPHTLREASVLGDDVLVKAVSSLAGVDIAHFVKTDANGIKQLVTQLGGVQMNVPGEVDDPKAGSTYIEAGEQTLDGEQILTFLRATNFKNGSAVQASNQVAFMTEVALSVLGDGSLSFMRTLDSLGGTFATDIKAKDASIIAESMMGVTADQVQGALVPGYERTSDGVAHYICSGDTLKEMMDRASQGQPLVDEGAALANVDPSSFTITVRNGSGVTGGATQLAGALKDFGYNVTETGNTDAYAYTETLVIYADSAYEDACESVVASLGAGRVVNGAGFYTFNTDVLVILGSDWAPVS